MPLRSAVVPPLPSGAAVDVFNLHNVYLHIGDRVEQLLTRVDPAELDASSDRAPGFLLRLALVTCFQYTECLPDHQAADALRTRKDWKYALHVGSDYPSFDPALLCEFRQRLLRNTSGQEVFECILAWLAESGLLANREGRQVTTVQVLNAVCTASRLEHIVETMSVALEALAAARLEWLRTITPAHWLKRYRSPAYLPTSKGEQEALTMVIGNDARYLLDAIDRSREPELDALPEVRRLRQVWQRQFELRGGQVVCHAACRDQCPLL